MSAKRWFIMLIAVTLVIAAVIVALNITVDPFGVFGGGSVEWDSYSMTLNPKTAKFVYVDSRIGEFDAFVIGPSGASGFSPEILEQHTDLRWFNMFNYGADMAYTRRLAEYLITVHEPEMLLLVVPIISAAQYDVPITDITYRQPLRPLWRAPFLFANPQFSTDKIRNSGSEYYLQQPFDVFNAATGTYDKSRRDAEAIGNLDAYLAANPEFADMYFPRISLAYIDETVAAVADILELAEQFGTQVIVTTTPMLHAETGAFCADEIREFYNALASVTGGFWDFSVSTISGDPRFFYDTTHFRNHVGEMMLARIFDYDNLWIPHDLGVFITPANALGAAERFSTFYPTHHSQHTQEIPILMYHDIIDDGSSNVPPDVFWEHIRELYVAGFTAVPLTALKDYVFHGIELPPNAVVITFDDGYLSNYVHAFPILERFGFHAAIFPMGISFGRDTHWYAGSPIRPRFGESEARRMVESGWITLQSHTFDMHHVQGFDPPPFRSGILRMDGESELEYANFLRNDIAQIRELLEPITGEPLFALAFPYGLHDELSAVILREAGIFMTFTTESEHATLVKGLPQSLLELPRFGVYGDMSGEDVVRMISR